MSVPVTLTGFNPVTGETFTSIIYQSVTVYDGYGTKYAGNKEYLFEYEKSISAPGAVLVGTTPTNGDSITGLRVHNTEGYVDDAGNYYYYRRDHLGNNREVWQFPPSGGQGAVIQRTQYYPSGLPWAYQSGDGADKQPYKYGGKEFSEFNGLDEYDSQARMLYPAIMRTPTPDPLAEKYYSISPYAWCGNNPVNYVDPDGRDWYEDGNGNARIWVDSQEATYYSSSADQLLYNTRETTSPIMTATEQISVYDYYKSNPRLDMGLSEFLPGGRLDNTTFLDPLFGAITDGISWTLQQTGLSERTSDIAANVSVFAGTLLLGRPKITAAKGVPTLTEQAATLSQRLGKNSITLGTPTKQIRFDLVGKAHGNVPTPHMQIYNKNFVNGVQKSISRASKEAVPMTQQEIRMIRKYIEKLGN